MLKTGCVMSVGVHQVIIGALNPGENCFSIGAVEGLNFIACAVGADIVILAPNFERVQIITGCTYKKEEIVNSVNCCAESGKICACYGNVIRILEPVLQQNGKHGSVFSYRWVEIQSIEWTHSVDNVQWALKGLRLLVLSAEDLLLYQHKMLSSAVSNKPSIASGSTSVKFMLADEEVLWENVWSTKLSASVKYVKFSPDGSLFATCGENDRFIKIWYQMKVEIERRVFRNDKKTSRPLLNFNTNNTTNMGRSMTIADFSVPASANSLVFALAATINAENDCYLVPSMVSQSKRPFTVHWLNNKEIIFTNAAERVLAETFLLDQQGGERSRVAALISSTSSGDIAEHHLTDEFRPSTAASTPVLFQHDQTGAYSMRGGSDVTSARDVLDVKLEGFLRQWNKSFDVLFSVHPVDGSLLTWTVEWLDDPWRQANVSFSSRFPDAFPLTDASSLYPTICIFNPHDPAYSEVLRRQGNGSQTALNADASSDLLNKISIDLKQHGNERWKLNSILLLTNHENGSLNLWQLSMDEQRNFSTVLNIAHKSRMCGHRFHISQVIAHPELPLLLTASQFMPMSAAEANGGMENLSATQGLRKSSATLSKESELILWTIAPVGPLCKSGGLRELARVTSKSPKAFVSMAWIPAILPSFVLGAICNSPSSCFVVSSNGNLCIYQAIVDARGLLAQVHKTRKRSRESSYSSLTDADHSQNSENTPEMSAKVPKDVFNIVSTQSTAKPGCVLYVADVADSKHSADDVIFLHIFDEDLAASSNFDGRSPDLESLFSDNIKEKSTKSTGNNSEKLAFSDRYLLVMIVRTSVEDRLRMWSLSINAKRAVPLDDLTAKENNTALVGDNGEIFYPSADPVRLSAAKLCVESEKVYDEKIEFGTGVKIVSCVAAAGHLSSASLYPSCRTPYTLLASCSDDQVRFLRCNSSFSIDGSNKKVYDWVSWKMVNESADSSLEMDGEIYSVSSAYSGRFACAFRSAGCTEPLEINANASSAQFVSTIAKNLELAVFECESSGGVEWLREDTFNLGKILEKSSRIYSSGSNAPDYEEGILSKNYADWQKPEKARSLVRIDWVSTEDGSHVLTVGIGNLISLFVQVSQNTAQHNIVMMKEHEMTRNKRAPLRKSSSLVGSAQPTSRLIRWTCIRTLELQAADGLPPLPTAMSWVRDGLLIVGMNSEMRVYNQWNLRTKIEDIVDSSSSRSPTTNDRAIAGTPARPKKLLDEKGSVSGSLMNISRSHSMLDHLNRKTVDPVTSSRMIKELMSRVISTARIHQELKDEGVMEAVSAEGLFEAARLANPMLPQYHPKQLIEMLNAGKTKRVKAILLHVLRALKHRQVSVPNPLSRAASFRKMYSRDNNPSLEENPSGASTQRRPSLAATIGPMDEANPDYDELDTISPLPLYALFAADQASNGFQKADNMDKTEAQNYDSLFNGAESDEDLDEVLDGIQNDDNISQRSARTRHSSGGSEHYYQSSAANTATNFTMRFYFTMNFTMRHSRLLTELLTHTHLPGLSSVDQMHLLAIADTISHFSSNVMDKLAHANAALKPVIASTLGDSTATGYASATMGTETVDECGLRFLMAMKQHEYLLLCLPPKQRKVLKSRGISSAHIIWAFHSVTEMELLSAIPCCQKSQEMWEELRAFGVAWWLKNTSTLRICVEKMAKSAFQQNQDPMDASLFYLALRKKNVLTHLFKTVNDSRMYDFFREDFTEEKWKRAALRNAFALMSKQRFNHAAAFFLLGGSLKDAVKAILSRSKDLQLALVVVRVYETDPEKQNEVMTELLCREVLGCTVEDVRRVKSNELFSEEINFASFPNSKDPFERSMAFWLIKEYAHAASTLVEEASKDHILETNLTEHSLSDIFNFYSYLRRHPLVVRQRLTNVGIQVASTEQFLAFAKKLEGRVTPSERRLYFRTASAHIALGCPLLALDVLSRLPKQFSSKNCDSSFLFNQVNALNGSSGLAVEKEMAEDLDWSAPTNVVAEDRLELEWSDDNDDNESDDVKANGLEKISDLNPKNTTKNAGENLVADAENLEEELTPKAVDFISQHLKYVAVLRVMMDELATLASGFEINGGQLRFELFNWLENECEVLHEICDFRPNDFQPSSSISEGDDDFEVADDVDVDTPAFSGENTESSGGVASRRFSLSASTAVAHVASSDPPLHESLRLDRINFKQRLQNMIRRRNWLRGHEKLLRILISYCSLHSAQNYRLTSIQMELLLLLLEVQSDSGVARFLTNEPIPDIHSFPLLASALTSCRMFVTSPLHFMQNQSNDILQTVAEFVEPPTVETSFPKAFMLYNLCQGLSSCVYQSLSDIYHFRSASTTNATGVLTSRVAPNYSPLSDEIFIKTSPSKWPGVEGLVALLSREKDEDTPNLRLLLVEFFISITMSLFCYALTIYDARWLYRLCAHRLDEHNFGVIFGGGGEKKLRSIVPSRPPPPNISNSAAGANIDKSGFVSRQHVTQSHHQIDADSAAIRAKLHAKVFGAEIARAPTSHIFSSLVNRPTTSSEQTVSCWVPPNKHIVQFFAEKVNTRDAGGASSYSYDSEEDEGNEDDEESLIGAEGSSIAEDLRAVTSAALAVDDGTSLGGPATDPRVLVNSYAWLLLRLTSVIHIQQRIRTFIYLAGFDVQDIATTSSHIDNVLKVLSEWTVKLEEMLDGFEGGCPDSLLRNTFVDAIPATVQQTPLLRKYSILLEPGNTPFESEKRGAGAARRLWCFLVRQENLSPYFIKHIFGRVGSTDTSTVSSGGVGSLHTTNGHGGTVMSESGATVGVTSEPMKIIQREHEPIIAFACNSVRPGCIVVSTGREIQEISLEKVFDESDRHFGRYQRGGSFLSSRVELDIAMQSLQRDTLRDNDDYQLITTHDHHPHHQHQGHASANGIGGGARGGGVQGSAYITSFVVDRSRVALQKLRKRPISGIRRLESHSTLPYYVSGSSDGSILMWEWGVDQPLFTARAAGQFAKVSKLAFAQNSNKFAAVDGDGLLCIWQASQNSATRRPFFSQRCHTKAATDVKFLGQTSSLLVTAGHSAGEQNVILWDTLMPQTKSMVHSFVGQHQEGATCVLYLSNSQSILSGGRHGEVCVWDLRQCQLRTVFKAFDNGAVRCMCVDPNCDVLVTGSSEGDIKVWSTDTSLQLLHTLSCEHVTRSGFTLRKLGSSSVQGVQQVFVDQNLRLFSCGADSSLKFRTLPSQFT